MQTINWQCLTFEELNTEQLLQILQLRQQVFVVEQECAYPDIDQADRQAWHLCGWRSSGWRSSGWLEQSLIGYARLLPPGTTYKEAAIGRVVVEPEARGESLGRQLMLRAIDQVLTRFPGQPIKVGAQQHLQGFYQSLGFTTVSKMYLEDGIPHVDMLRADNTHSGNSTEA